MLTTSTSSPSPWRFCIAPMMEWTDRHCRFFFRQLSRHARLYTEMITTGALLRGDVARHLEFDPQEQPVALQLGGSERAELARCARLGAAWGYAEINLNCGCPSPRVQRGAFGACLMAEPNLVADCVKAMQDAVSIPITVKHRIGIDRSEGYELVRDFVAPVYDAGCRVFIVHARNAWLHGLSPKENRELPPLRLNVVHRLQKDFGGAAFVTNGGLRDIADAQRELAHCTGVMFGRAAYHDPMLLAQVDRALFAGEQQAPGRDQVVAVMRLYLARVVPAGVAPRAVLRHMLNLYQGQAGARAWRRQLSDSVFLRRHGAEALTAASEPSLAREVLPASPPAARAASHHVHDGDLQLFS